MPVPKPKAITQPWTDLQLSKTDWNKFALAFYELAHHDFDRFDQLPPDLKKHQVGVLCSKFIKTADNDFLDQAGHLLTGSRDWYTYLGRLGFAKEFSDPLGYPTLPLQTENKRYC